MARFRYTPNGRLEMQTSEIMQFAHTQLIANGLYVQGWRFKMNSNKRRLGVCKFSRSGRGGMIELSKYVVDDFKIKDTILHEIAHAIVGPSHGHNHVWRSKAISLGCTGERCGHMEAPHSYGEII